MQRKMTRYDIEQLDLLCSLALYESEGKVTPADFEVWQAWRQDQSRILAIAFDSGQHIARDPRKAAKYAAIAKNADLSKSSILSTENAYNAHSWYTSIRLFLGRAKRVLSFFTAMSNSLKTVLGIIFNIASLSYIFSFLFDLGVVIKSTFIDPRQPHEEDYSFWKLTKTRLANVLLKGSRISRMLNDLIWFAINLSCILLVVFFPPIAPLASFFLITIGFSFDVVNETCKAAYDVFTHKSILKKLDHEPERFALKNKAVQEALTNKLQNKLHLTYISRARILFMVSMIALAMFLLVFPPVTLPVVLIAASIAALVCGSLLIGLGPKLLGAAGINVDRKILDGIKAVAGWFKGEKHMPAPPGTGSIKMNNGPPSHKNTAHIIATMLPKNTNNIEMPASSSPGSSESSSESNLLTTPPIATPQPSAPQSIRSRSKSAPQRPTTKITMWSNNSCGIEARTSDFLSITPKTPGIIT